MYNKNEMNNLISYKFTVESTVISNSFILNTLSENLFILNTFGGNSLILNTFGSHLFVLDAFDNKLNLLINLHPSVIAFYENVSYLKYSFTYI